MKVKISGDFVVSGGTDTLVCCWRLADGAKTWESKRPAGIVSLSCCSDLVFSGCLGGSLCCNDLSSGATHWEKGAHTGAVNDVSASPDGKLLVSCSNDCKVSCWDVEDNGNQQWQAAGHTSWVTKVAVLPKHVVSSSLDKTVCCWSLSDGSALWVATHDSAVLKLSVGDGICCCGTQENKIVCMDLQQGTVQWDADVDEVSALDVQEGQIYSGSCDGTLRCFSGNTGKLMWTLQHGAVVTSICHAGVFSASGSADKEVRCWERR